MSYEDKILDKFADMIMPPGTIIAYQGIEAPEGFIVYDHIKIYEDEFPRLYPVLAANPNFNKGADSDGRKWVELPEIEDLCIQMTTDTSQVGKTLEAQLPNIGGSIYFRNGVTERTLWTFLGGSFKDNGITDNMTQSAEMGQLTEVHASKVSFSALDSSAIYSGNSMQPKALSILPCVRV